MLKTLNSLRKQEKEKYKVPRRVQDLIPIRRIWADGIFQVGSQFCRTWKFSDINYQVASEEDKKVMFLDYSELLNSLDSGSAAKITVNNRTLNRANFEQSVLMPMQEDCRDKYRVEYNGVIMGKATAGNGIVQEKYITITVPKKNIAAVDSYYQANMDFLKPEIRNYFFKEMPMVCSKVADLPPAKYNPGAVVRNSLVGSGSIINGIVENSVVFKKVFVGNNCVIKNSVILNDVYLGDNAYIENCIVDSRNTIRANTRHVAGKGIEVVVEEAKSK